MIIEITETSVIASADIVNVFMRKLHKKGISFSLDDFGAGFTAFRFFKEFKFDIIKIDGQFIKNIYNDVDNQVLTEILVSLAKHFKMFTVAEHVENKHDMKYLQKTKIDCLQGYYTGTPQTVPEWSASKQCSFQIRPKNTLSKYANN